jgi:hypothetical protein
MPSERSSICMDFINNEAKITFTPMAMSSSKKEFCKTKKNCSSEKH